MKKISYFLLFLFASLLMFWSCSSDTPEPDMDSGELDFGVYVSVGNSLTAGYADGDLYKSAQMVAYPNIIAAQLQHLGGGDFVQPLMFDELGLGNRLVLEEQTDCNGIDTLAIVLASGVSDPENQSNIYDQEEPFHNMGVPGATVEHLLLPGYALFNPYFSRFASAQTTSIMRDVMRLNPTFFSLWIGNNDVLYYASSGGGQSAALTQPDDFENAYQEVLQDLLGKTSFGVVANIPDITSIPYFTSIEPTGLWAQEDGGQVRQLTSDDIVLLTAFDQINCENMGTSQSNPIPENLWLSKNQIDLIQETILAYNAIIENMASDHDLALVDMHQLMETAVQGIVYDGLTFTTDFVYGGIFSLDGIHLSPRGNAIVANAFLSAINQKYEISIPLVSVTQFPGINFP